MTSRKPLRKSLSIFWCPELEIRCKSSEIAAGPGAKQHRLRKYAMIQPSGVQ
jgi:hypothetical protein